MRVTATDKKRNDEDEDGLSSATLSRRFEKTEPASVPLPSALMLCWYQLASLGAAWKWTVHVENLHLIEVLNGYRASHSPETGGTVTSGQKWENVPPQEWHLRKRIS
ncbi:uncharacterized protein LOC111337492 isoform X2 [Stylophora pistillata]|uniref:uncharacterized protein LOC111337492 isoform X2 n=1 Tax=Stylophora pistillata TaxID=50429 RepID=UPI000C048605|nr:uncharacterized protein LOC111337492 isoform X2 [Stylophora pistillata]